LFDKRLQKANFLKKALEGKEKEAMYWVHAHNDACDKRNELKIQIENLEKKLETIRNLVTGNVA
jgi:hypothetical protein